MNTKTKSILAGVLVLGGGAVWLPQLVGANATGTAETLPEVPNDAPATEAHALAVLGSEPTGDGASLPPWTPDVSDPAAIERALARADTMTGRGSELDLGELLSALDPGRAGTDPAPAADADVRKAEDDRRLLATAAATLVVTGTLAGREPIALIDGRLVRIGDALDDERVLLHEVAAGAIVLACGEARLRVRLAPLRARASAPITPEEGEEPARSDASAAGSGAGGLADVLPVSLSGTGPQDEDGD